jgi:tRNA pseudouridine65 synthase
MSKHLDIIYQDEHLVAINKPAGLLVHRSAIDRHATEFALQTVRDQIGQTVYPVHRLDRPTSGALVFALSPASARSLAQEFADSRVKKTYLAVVRGTPPDEITVHHALKEELDEKSDRMARTDKEPQVAETHITKLTTFEFPVAVDKFPTSIYSLVRAHPKTGRKHQIRRHLRHLGHPIIGDVTYGSGKHNRFFRESLQTERLLLACTGLAFIHPVRNEFVEIQAPLADDFRRLFVTCGWEDYG